MKNCEPPEEVKLATRRIGVDRVVRGLRISVAHVWNDLGDTTMNKDEIIKQVVDLIRRRLPGAEFRVVLFGSWARGDAQETSDIDIGLMGPEAVDDMLLWRIKQEIMGIPTLRRIDVVDLNQADENFRREVLSYAQPL